MSDEKKIIKNKIIIIIGLIVTLVLTGVVAFVIYFFHPMISCPTDLYLTVGKSTEEDLPKVATFLGKDKQVPVLVKGEVDFNQMGDYTVTLYTNEKGLINTKKEVVCHVVDNLGPEILLNGDAVLKVQVNTEYIEFGASAVDNVDGDVSSSIRSVNNIDINAIGEYEVHYLANDSRGNESETVRVVQVTDTIGPEIMLNRKVNGYAILNAKVDLYDFVATDNFDGDVTDKVEVIGEVDTSKEGLYTVTYRVADSFGNQTELISTINVQKKNTKGIPVLMYHWFYNDQKGQTYYKNLDYNYISKTNFEKQMKYLVDNNYYLVSWEELEDYIDGKISLPAKSVILTDDDGNQSFYSVCIPVLTEYNLTCTSFAITNKTTGGGDPMAWSKHLDCPYLDYQSHTDSLHVSYNVSGGIRGIALDKTAKQIENDLLVFNKKIGKDCTVLAYPFGHYNNNFITALKKTGYKMAFTTVEGRVKPGMNKYTLPRVRMNRKDTVEDFARKIAG